jgi:hypothetical protein
MDAVRMALSPQSTDDARDRAVTAGMACEE